jgi:hypothetical protein
MYTGTGHSAVATNLTIFKFLANHCLSFNHEINVPVSCSRLNLEVTEDFLGWLLNDLQGVKDPVIQSKLLEFIKVLSQWRPVNPEWVFFANKLAPLLAFKK